MVSWIVELWQGSSQLNDNHFRLVRLTIASGSSFLHMHLPTLWPTELRVADPRAMPTVISLIPILNRVVKLTVCIQPPSPSHRSSDHMDSIQINRLVFKQHNYVNILIRCHFRLGWLTTGIQRSPRHVSMSLPLGHTIKTNILMFPTPWTIKAEHLVCNAHAARLSVY